jgi:hypothetical protein
MTNEMMRGWLRVVWNRRPEYFLRKQGMLVLDALKGHLTPESNLRFMQEILVLQSTGRMNFQQQVFDAVL